MLQFANWEIRRSRVLCNKFVSFSSTYSIQLIAICQAINCVRFDFGQAIDKPRRSCASITDLLLRFKEVRGCQIDYSDHK